MSLLNAWKGRPYSFIFTDPSKPVRTFRSRRPCHFIFEIKNYSDLVSSMQAAGMTFFETPEFTASGEKWTMCIYPFGKGTLGNNHVSLYLRRQKSGGPSKEASVSMKFFILEQNSDEYLVIEDLGEKNFDVRGKEWGIPQAIENIHFQYELNGFLIDKNKCTFGAEVFVTSAEPSYSQLALVTHISKTVFEIGIKFDSPNDYSESDIFTTTFFDTASGESYNESYNWKLRLYRNGFSEGTGTHVSLFLLLVDDTNKLSSGRKLLVNFQFSLKNKDNGLYTHTAPASLAWYHSTQTSVGCYKFIEKRTFFDPSNKYDDYQTAYVKVEFKSVFMLNDADG